MKKYYAEDIFKLAEGIEPSADDRAVYLCSEADEVISGLRTSLGKSVKDVLSFMHQLDEKDAVIAELRGQRPVRPVCEDPTNVLAPDVFQPDGGLYSLGWYLAWTPGDQDAVLDGRFEPKELRAIAHHMETGKAPAQANTAIPQMIDQSGRPTCPKTGT